jgi:thioredoxin 1
MSMTKRSVWRIAVLLLLAVTVIVVLASKPGRGPARSAPVATAALMATHGAMPAATGIPRLVDLGADKCIPCKAMAPILFELRTEYSGRMQVDFIDVWKNPGAGDPFNIYAIPTQIFFDESGKELTRHEGFISKQDILATWKRFGCDFGQTGVPTPKS